VPDRVEKLARHYRGGLIFLCCGLNYRSMTAVFGLCGMAQAAYALGWPSPPRYVLAIGARELVFVGVASSHLFKKFDADFKRLDVERRVPIFWTSGHAHHATQSSLVAGAWRLVT
jgi:hypothetical protein